MVPEAGLEPARTKSPRDFKSLVSTNSTTPAYNKHKFRKKIMEATPGFEPGIRILQTLALPLGDVATHDKYKMERETGLEPATTTLATWSSTTELLPPTCELQNSKTHTCCQIIYEQHSPDNLQPA